MEEFIIATTEHVPGYRVVKVLGIARGATVRAKHIGKDILAGLRNIVGGEVKEYTEMLAEAREVAIQRMIEHAKSMGANAVIGVRFMTSSIAAGAAEIFAYGTAVILEKE
ncbi:YbjQ family protein [Thermococcus sp. M39]|uniref:YbjQ family protein n=1 Tax=unclassified Thermococcus TaxID=2627626 RepID=UPI00143975C0|nr:MULTISPECIES: YbjQ family protein [unclassified Thermococcus]NJE08795.1 YbjQ family protein [Thermococcus sp. M39]NJE12028.1 YbjQ family protein [Thermococcus sp. LS2]